MENGDLVMADAGYGTARNYIYAQEQQADAAGEKYLWCSPLKKAEGQNQEMIDVFGFCRYRNKELFLSVSFSMLLICISECHHISTTTDLPSDLSPFNHCHFSDNSILPLSKICGTLWQTPIRTCFCSFMCR